MEFSKTQKKQSLKVIISEAIMVLVVVVTVAILALIVSGYWLNSDLKVERNGMVQIYSTPTGANVNIDGKDSSWLERTNTSKVLASGEHTITLTKDGYDSWTKTINISEGLLYRLHYPRLFWQDRTPEEALNTASATFATISPSGERLLLANDTTEWSVVGLSDDTLNPKKINIASYFSDVSLADEATVGLFGGKILAADWDHDNRHLLFQIQTTSGATEWVLLDTDNVKNSLNLTKEFGADFTAVEILDNSASNLLAIQGGNLHKIDISGKSISSVLVKQVIDFDHYENEIVFSAAKQPNQADQLDQSDQSDQTDQSQSGDYIIGLAKANNDKLTILEATDAPAKVALSKFYDNMYISVLTDTELNLYQKTDFDFFAKYDFSFAPSVLKVGHSGEFITLYTDAQIATLDMEAGAVREWSTDGRAFGWLDNDMIYSVAGGELFVYDYDGLNRRSLAANVSSHFPATITDNKWLYYFSDGNLIREKITN